MQIDGIFLDFFYFFLLKGEFFCDIHDSQNDNLPLVALFAFGHLDCVGHILFEMQYHVVIHGFLGFLRIHNQLAKEVLAFLDDLQIHAVEVDVDELISPNKRFFYDFVLISLKVDELAVFI